MIASFFQSLSAHDVEYLLISGQATVVYGAASFSEDIDIWLRPTEANCGQFLVALQSQDAKYYKLTPALTLPHLQQGHGFHFAIEGTDEFFLDVMGVPPRAPSFDEAMGQSRSIQTEWGRLPVVGIKHLVEIKKTQRMSDYPIIGQLVLKFLEEQGDPSTEDYLWALDNTFTLPELRQLIREHPAVMHACERVPELKAYGERIADGSEPDEELESLTARWLSDRVLASQASDRQYWRPIIRSLKELKKLGQLMPEGADVVLGL